MTGKGENTIRNPPHPFKLNSKEVIGHPNELTPNSEQR